ncbi:MAG: hypothetical protein R3Y08_03680, partial [Rikenellaceae bacterium]
RKTEKRTESKISAQQERQRSAQQASKQTREAHSKQEGAPAGGSKKLYFSYVYPETTLRELGIFKIFIYLCKELF